MNPIAIRIIAMIGKATKHISAVTTIIICIPNVLSLFLSTIHNPITTPAIRSNIQTI